MKRKRWGGISANRDNPVVDCCLRMPRELDENRVPLVVYQDILLGAYRKNQQRYHKRFQIEKG